MGEAREVMDRATEAAMSQDFDTLVSLYAPDVVITDPIAGEIRGDIIGFFKSFTDAFPDLAYQSTAGHEAGNVAIDEGFVTGTHSGPLELSGGEVVNPTGRQIRIRSCDVATVENGVVTRHNFYYDQWEFLSQLGLAPEPTSA